MRSRAPDQGEQSTGRRSRRTPLYAFLAVAALLLATFATPAPQTSREASGSELGGDFQHGTVQVPGGSDVHYVIGGSGPPVVLLHGWPETWWIWRDVMPSLAEDYTVIAFDLPGLGDSTVPRGGFDKLTTAKRLRQAVRQLGFREVTVVGHDIGALIAYPWAREFPNEVDSLAVLEIPLIGFGLEDFFGASWHLGFNMTAAPVPEQILDDEDVPVYLGWLFDSAVHPDRIDQETFFEAYADPANRSAGYEYYRAFPQDAQYNQAAAAVPITMPVLAMGAESVFGPVVAESFENVADDVRMVVAPDSGHWIAQENPQFVIDCLRLFLDSSAPATPPAPSLANCVR